MKYFLSFIVAIFIHIILYWYIVDKKNSKQKPYNLKSYKNTSKIRYIKLAKKNIPKKIKHKKVSKKKLKNKPKEVSRIIDSAIKSYKKNINNKDISKDDDKIDNRTKQYIKLYGDDFKNYDKVTKLFIINHIKDIGYITQQFLEYPYLSIQASQSGMNVVSFFLHPNGKITNLKIEKSSKYFLLDDNTIETIQKAYEQYPKPSKTTLIKIFVTYILN